MTVHADFTNCDHFNGPYFDGVFRKFDGPQNPLYAPQSKTNAGFYRRQYPASYMHKSLGRTCQFTLPGSDGTQTCFYVSH